MVLPREFSSVTFKTVSFEALTSFFAFHCRTEENGTSLEQRFVVNVPLEGCPENRHDRLLLSILRDRKQVIHYLFLLLADDGTETRGVLDLFTRRGETRRGGHEDRFYEVPLLEPLIQALARDPVKLDRVHRLVEDLRKTEEGRQRLPDGFKEVWRPIWQARQRLGGKS